MAELVQSKVDVLVLVTSPAIRAAKQATKTIPIVMVTTADPVATGLVDSLARPGGNITGLTRITRDLNGKRLELLKEVVPTTPRVGVLFQAGSTSGDSHFKEYETAARALKIELQSLGVRGQNPDFEAAFRAAAKGRVSGLITITNSLTNFYRKEIAALAIKHRLPSMYETSRYVEAGGLMSYSANEAESFRRAAVYVDKILKGTKPADIPVEQPTKFELVINLKTAKRSMSRFHSRFCIGRIRSSNSREQRAKSNKKTRDKPDEKKNHWFCAWRFALGALRFRRGAAAGEDLQDRVARIPSR